MSEFKIVMPKLGESIQEGTITKWFVKEGDTVEEDDMLFEVATDKVDSEIPSPVDGVVKNIVQTVDSLVPVGEVVAILEMEGEDDSSKSNKAEELAVTQANEEEVEARTSEIENNESVEKSISDSRTLSNRFYSPLVKTIAKEENISFEELETIDGSGANGRVQKKDILNYIKTRSKSKVSTSGYVKSSFDSEPQKAKIPVSIGAEDQIIEMANKKYMDLPAALRYEIETSGIDKKDLQ